MVLGANAENAEEKLMRMPGIKHIEACAPGVARIILLDDTSHHVLQDSGEVIGRDDVRPNTVEKSQAVRSDWSNHLNQHGGAKATSGSAASLYSSIRSPDEDSFCQGLSKHFAWRLRHMQNRVLAADLQKAAQAYIIHHLAVSIARVSA